MNTVAKKTPKKQGRQKKSNPVEIPFLMIPAGDRQKVRKLGLGLQDYWLDCWEADAYGSRWVLMSRADLKNTTDAKYRKQLENLELFMFEIRKSGGDRTLWVLNLHGSRVKDFWKSSEESLDQNKEQGDVSEEPFDQNEKKLDQIEQKKPETVDTQGFQNLSTSSQQHLNNTSTTPQRSVEVLEDSAAITQPPLRVAAMATSEKDPKEEWDVEKSIKEVLEECARYDYYPNPDQLSPLHTFVEIQFPPVFQWLKQLKTCPPSQRSKIFGHALRMGRFALKAQQGTSSDRKEDATINQ